MSEARKKVIIYRRGLLNWSETFIREQALAMRKWQPVLIGNNRVEKGLPLDGIDIHLLSSPRARKFKRITYSLFCSLGWPYPPHLKLLRSIHPHLIHAHFGIDGVAIWPYARSLGLPLFITLHGYDINTYRAWWEDGHGGHSNRNYPRQLLSLANNSKVHFIAVSQAIRQRAIDFGIPEEKITVSYIGIDTDQFKPSGMPVTQRRKRILFVGRMVEKKAPLLMVHAFEQIRGHIPDAELVMVGDGPLRARAEQLARTLRLPVMFAGVMTGEQVLGQLSESRVLCLPSVTAANGDAEGFGMVLLEAQACGVPVVSSARGGSTEGILEGITGFACPENDLNCLANRLERCLVDDRLAENMSHAAVSFMRDRFDLTARTEALEDIYEWHAT
ncbi:MAG: glycosyltransferase [Rhodocyclaceae bacterium]